MPDQTELLFHYIGKPVALENIRNHKDVKYSPLFDMYSLDRISEFSFLIERHAFGENSSLDTRIQTKPRIAFKANDIASALKKKEIVIPLCEPFVGYRCTMVQINGTLIELIETSSPEEKIRHDEATLKSGILYDGQEGKLSPREE